LFNSDTQTVLTVTSISRPKRVAFLVHSENIDNNGINQIIRYSIGTWGGRFHAIIPTSGEEIAPAWWKLLTILDPDIIYSFLPLNDKLIQRINRHILPAKIIEPNKRANVEDTYRINTFEIGALGIEDIPRFKWESRGFLDKPSFFYIKEGKENNQNNSFALCNFGTLPKTADLSIESLFRDIPCEIIEPNGMMPTKILETIFEKAKPYPRRIIMPIDFCQMYASRNYSLDYADYTRGFHLVVGNQPLDAIYAWNRALISDLTSGRNGFWLAEEHSQDKDLLRLLSRWIDETFWTGNIEKKGYVISHSVDLSFLQNLAQKMCELTHFHFKAFRINPDDFPCPNARKFIPSLFERGQVCQTDKVPLSEDKGLVGFQRPPFLIKGHPQFGWMADLEIQYHPERYNWTNVRPTWKLPKRLGLAHKFYDNYKRSSRIVNGGLPSIEAATEDTVIHIRIPSDLAVVWTWLEHRTNTRNHSPQTTPLFTEIHVSDKGRYLQGIIRLFGNIYSAGSIFEDPFWRDVLLRMAGKPDYHKDFTEIKKIILKSTNEISTEDPTQVVTSPRFDQFAEKLTQKLLSIDVKSNELTLEQLKGRFSQLRGEVLREDPNNGWWKANEKFDEVKEQELQNLLEKKVFLQGLELSCPHCGTRQWYVVDDLGSEMRCNGCLFYFPLPPDTSWSFRLNDLVQNALRKHGTLAVLHTLYELQRDSFSEMFLYLPCQDIFKNDRNAPFTDLDIVVIKEGKFIIGEVKSDPSGFTHSDFEKLKEVAIDLLPNEMLLAAPGDKWPEDVFAGIKNLTDALKPIDVTVSPQLLRW